MRWRLITSATRYNFIGPIHVISPRVRFYITPSDPPKPIEPGTDG